MEPWLQIFGLALIGFIWCGAFSYAKYKRTKRIGTRTFRKNYQG